MSFINIDIKTDDVEYSIGFDHHINFVRGDSGIGKTSLVELISSSEGIDLNSTFPIRLADNTNWDLIMQSATNSIIIFDDMKSIESTLFADNVSKYCIKNNQWYLIIDRAEIDSFRGKRLSYAANAIYRMETDGRKHWLEPYYKFVKPDLTNIDTFLVEDAASGYVFFSKNFSNINVVSAEHGKSAVVEKTLELARKQKKVLIFADMASFGCHIDSLVNIVLTDYKDIQILWDYECFEELLLQTNLLKNLSIVRTAFNNLPKSASGYSSWEKYFEYLSQKATENLLCRYNHNGELYDCYYIDCDDCNSYKAAKCTQKLEGLKIEALLKETKYDCLLECSEKARTDTVK